MTKNNDDKNGGLGNKTKKVVSEMRVFVDLDGVLADFDGTVKKDQRLIEALRRYKELLQQDKELSHLDGDDLKKALRGEQQDELRKKIKKAYNEYTRLVFTAATKPGYFLDLDVLPGAEEMLRSIRSLTGKLPHILTAPILNSETCEQEKQIWVKENLNGLVDLFICTQDKHLYAKSKFDILIDDRPKYVDKFAAAGGSVVLHADPKNSIEELKSVIKNLQESYAGKDGKQTELEEINAMSTGAVAGYTLPLGMKPVYDKKKSKNRPDRWYDLYESSRSGKVKHVWHITPDGNLNFNRRGAYSPKFGSRGIFVSPSYESIANSWADWVNFKKYRELDKPSKGDKIYPHDTNIGYRKLYLYKIEIPAELYSELETAYEQAAKDYARARGLEKVGALGAFYWDLELFIPEEYFSQIKIVGKRETSWLDFQKTAKKRNKASLVGYRQSEKRKLKNPIKENAHDEIKTWICLSTPAKSDFALPKNLHGLSKEFVKDKDLAFDKAEKMFVSSGSPVVVARVFFSGSDNKEKKPSIEKIKPMYVLSRDTQSESGEKDFYPLAIHTWDKWQRQEQELDEEYIGKKGGVRYFQMGGSLPDALYNKEKTGKPTRKPGVAGLKRKK